MSRFKLTLAFLLATAALPAAAADPKPTLDQRVDRVEKQLKAVQRKVFPGGDAALQTPEIAPAETHVVAGTPAGIPLNELTARVDSLERSVAQLTGQVEENQHRLDLLSQQSAQDRQEFATRLKLLETANASAAAALSTAPAAAAEPAPAAARPGPAKPHGATPTTDKPKPEAVVSPAKTTALAKLPATKPAAAAADAPASTDAATATPGDPAEADYMAGYKLWAQKKYPQAETALAAVVKKYPHARRASYAQNLLGRAYLDDGQPARAAEAFAANYTSNPHGERAPDSLYFLGQSLMALKKPADACRVYDELDSAYGDKVEAPLKAKVTAARTDAKCK